MIELLGALGGAVARLAPEVMTLLDKKNERKHEKEMQELSMEADSRRAQQGLDKLAAEGRMLVDGKAMDALVESIKAQGRPTGVAWVDALSASVRPILTYWWVGGLWSLALGAEWYVTYHSGTDALVAFLGVWGEEERALASSMASFWFLGRVLEKRGSK